MLIALKVKGLGIIEEMNWNPGEGLNVITGETGAGKSLVIEAVESLLTGKLDEEAIRTGAAEAQIEGVFVLPRNGNFAHLRDLLNDKGIQLDDDTLVIHCEIKKQGRSLVRLNGTVTPKGVLQQISHYLVDVHGQSEHLSLLSKRYQLDFLDAYAHILNLRDSFGTKVSELNKAEQELKQLIEAEKDTVRRQEFLQFQIDEINHADLREGEQEELEAERNRLSSCEKLKSLSYEAYEALCGEEASSGTSAMNRLNEAIAVIKKLVEIDPLLKPQADFLNDTLYGMDEAARAIRSYSEGLEYDPRRLEEVEARLELLRNLKRKYGQTIAEVLEYLKKSEADLANIAHSSGRRLELDGICIRLRAEMGKMAQELSQKRSRAVKKMVAEVKKELKDLNMAGVEFDIAISLNASEDGLLLPDGKTYSFSSEGVDNVEYMAATNPGEPLKPLAKIASTGEISRFMLALKSALSQVDNTPVLIFDEIDIGVGGRSGEIIGKKLWLLARDRQMLCVTHLPQIAAFADSHYRVRKNVSGKRTLSLLESLNERSKVEELAAMLTGSQTTETSLKNARELVKNAQSWKATVTETN